MVTAGVDIGSTTSKAVLLKDSTIMGQVIIPSAGLPAELAREVFEQCCQKSGVDKSEIKAIATTGYGRRNANFGDMVITEIKAAGRGASMIEPPSGKIFTIIDVGGQDTKVIALNVLLSEPQEDPGFSAIKRLRENYEMSGIAQQGAGIDFYKEL